MSKSGFKTAVLIGAGLLVSSAAMAEKQTLFSSVTAELYGSLRVDMSYDSNRAYPGNYVLYVTPTASADNQMNITANQTRLGLNLSGLEVAGAKITGKFEMDLYGGGAENKSTPMLRHAYLEMNWLAHNLSLLAGQTWDLVSPLTPDTVNYSPCWLAGDIGYRRPQIRLSKNWVINEKSKLAGKVALARSMGRANKLTGVDTGAESGLPVVQGSLAYQGPLFTSQPAQVGLSGHWAREENDLDTVINADTYLSWSVSADLLLPLADKLAIKANAWKGADVEVYLGGIGQGINTTQKKSIPSRGGWVSLGLGPWWDTKFNLGGSIDFPEEDLLTSGQKTQNTALFANANVSLMPQVTLGLEISYWRTLYKNVNEANDVRGQSSLTFAF